MKRSGAYIFMLMHRTSSSRLSRPKSSIRHPRRRSDGHTQYTTLQKPSASTGTTPRHSEGRPHRWGYREGNSSADFERDQTLCDI
jgi:hypothetical protein